MDIFSSALATYRTTNNSLAHRLHIARFKIAGAMVERMARSLETNWGVMKEDVSKFDGIYRREASLCRQFFEKKPQQYCHLSCLDLLRSTNIPCGNYILAWKKHELESSLWYLVSRISMSMEIVIRISLKNHLNLCFQASKGFRFWVWALLPSFEGGVTLIGAS